MVITVAFMLLMKTSIDNKVYMIPVSYRLMPAARPVSMLMKMFFITFIGILIIYI